MIVRESIKNSLRKIINEKSIINEIDWEGEFSDVKKECINTNELVKYLNSVRDNADKTTKDRNKFAKNKPFIHSKSSFFNEGQDIDVDYFIKRITEKPKYIIGTSNEKLQNTGGGRIHVYKTGIPALRGIVYDKQNDKFYFVNTCPGSGSCALICYALKGNYIIYPASYDKMTRVLNYLLNEPDEFENQLYEELKNACIENKSFEGYKSKVMVRWNDSGDFFTKKYVKIAENTINRLKKEGYNIDSYAYTKVSYAANDPNLNTTFSSDGNKSELKKVDLDKMKKSVIIPRDLSKGLNLLKLKDEEEYKKRVIDFFKLEPKFTITYDEMMGIREGDKPKWNVIVTPNDGDDAAFRKDVKIILLKEH